ncbi:MAG: Zn-ribbon domain-containing OB-fold protein [Acidimicrobiales bacterium]
MPRLEPSPTTLSQPFWEATRERRLLVQWCENCDAGIYYPRWACPSCLGEALSWRPASGRASLYTFNVLHPGANPMMADLGLICAALVDLEEGVRMVSNLVGCDPGELEVGMAVTLDWEPLSDGRHLPVFRPGTAGLGV